MHRLLRCLLFLLTLVTLPAAAEAQPKMTLWDRDHPLPARLGAFDLSWSRATGKGDIGGDAILHVTDPQGRKADIRSVIAFEDVDASLGLGRIDPGSPKPQLLLTSFTGGAHCCVHIQILDFVQGRWRTVDVGEFDGEPFSTFPIDIDGDGVTDIEHWDDRFAYAFGCYACSWMPPRVFNVRGGELRDVSEAPRYRSLYVDDYEQAKAKCLMHANPACAGLVADGYRLGRQDEAWAIAVANINREDEWILPGCKVKASPGKCPRGQEYRSREFRPALSKFLADIGIARTIR